MSVKNPKIFWQEISKKNNWKDYILPRKSPDDFDREGFLEMQRLLYFYDKNSIVVDYGCGIGRVAKYVAMNAKKVIGLDINDDFVEIARNYVKSPNAEFYCSDVFFEEKIADFVYCLMVLQHNDADNRKKIIRQINNLLKIKGTVVINFPRFESDYYKETMFVHKFKRDEVEEYGKFFTSYKIIEGNLPNYEKIFNKNISHEYFLIANT